MIFHSRRHIRSTRVIPAKAGIQRCFVGPGLRQSLLSVGIDAATTMKSRKPSTRVKHISGLFIIPDPSILRERRENLLRPSRAGF